MTPGVTIGIPVFNRADTLRRAIESALAQTRAVDVIHVSDNASTDATPEIGREMAARHPRVVFTRHDNSLGLAGNFGFLLQHATTEHFMWLAADDIIAPTYVEKTLAALLSDPSLAACCSRCLFVEKDGTERMALGTFPLMSDRISNLSAYLAATHDNTRAFALYRTRVLQQAFTPNFFHAYDLAVVAATLMHGRHAEIPEVLMQREVTPYINYVRNGARDIKSKVGRYFPAWPVTVDLIRRVHIPLRWPVIRALLYLNAVGHLEFISAYHRRYAAWLTPIMSRHLLWRLTLPLSDR